MGHQMVMVIRGSSQETGTMRGVRGSRDHERGSGAVGIMRGTGAEGIMRGVRGRRDQERGQGQ
jgi:hypothetical protein